VLGEFKYKDNSDCRWLLAPLKLFAPYFTLEFLLMDSEIGRDMLYIHDGPNMNAPILAQVSGGNVTMPLMMSSGENLFIRFKTDKLKAKAGFFISWDTMKECGGLQGFCADGGPTVYKTTRPKQGYCQDETYLPREHAKKGRCRCHFGWFGGDCTYRWCLGAKSLNMRIGSFLDHHDEVSLQATTLC